MAEIDVSVDNDGGAAFESESLTEALSALLSAEGRVELSRVTANLAYVDAQVLRDAGFSLRFNMSRLEVLLESIDPDLRLVQPLAASTGRQDLSAPTVAPGDFSAYLSMASNFEYSEGQFDEGFRNPDVLAFGAIRAGRFALQYEGGLSERGEDGYGPYRRFVRGIYDLEDRNIRLSAGDLQAETISILGTQLVGGFGIERRKRIFSPFDPVFQLGGRRILINSPSTIEIASNGQVIRTIPVDEGVYDLQELPLVSGANDVEIIVRDAAGRTSVTSFNYFYDPVELEPGDFEYGGYIGLVSDFDSLEPNYSDNWAATGFYRRAFTPSLLIGGAVQASSRSQAVAAELRWVPQVIPGAMDSQVAVSNGTEGIGYAARVGYRWGRSTAIGGRQISFLADFESEKFEPISRPAFLNERRFNITANYGQNVTRRTYLSAGVNYFKRGNTRARTTLFADVLHQFRSDLRGTLGVEYGSNDGLGSAFGVRASLTWLIGRNSRANAAVESRRDLYRASYSRGLDNRVGAIGYDASIQSSEGRGLADASFRYRGNRFDGRVLVSGSGDGIGNVFDNRRAQFQFSTSLAFADGAFGIGRPITDGFALVTPHPAIEGDAIVGNRLNGGEYQARSGTFGAAVVPGLIGYQTREIIYDIDSIDTVYDTGDGTDRIRVPTGGGAKVIVGDFRFVSAVGTLISGNEPEALVSGTVTSQTDEGFPQTQFFTNYAGRFSIIGLAPGERYQVTLMDGRGFEVEVPADSDGLWRVEDIVIEEIEE